jgi:D-ribose pyranase
MKKRGVLNAHLSGVIASLGHSDRLVVADVGLPIPRDAETVDLALATNIPRFLDTVRVILEESKVDSAIVAAEMETVSKPTYDALVALLAGVKLMKVPHEEFKRLTRNGDTVTFVRTGEATPYANVILVSGVTFT